MRRAYWQVDGQPGSPWHNMTEDRAMLAALCEHRLPLPVIRLYRWDRPAVTIGRLQAEEPVQQHYPDLPCVRRPTGGRAVLHGEDLTVSVAVPAGWLPGDSGVTILSSYRLLMAPLVCALTETGHTVHFGGEKPLGIRGSIHCFDLAAGCDLIDPGTGRKLVGSAQRREGDALLQQMSLPLALLPDQSAFLGVLQRGFQQALGIEKWLFIDTFRAVCYTDTEESEGSHLWPARF